MSRTLVSAKYPRPKSIAVSACAVAAAVLLAGCAPTYTSRPGGYYGGQPGGYYTGGRQCNQGCGYVRDIQEVRLDDGGNNNSTIGTVIGALVGGALGNQVGKGDGRKAATIAGAVAGGFAGHAVGERNQRGDYGWQVAVQLDNGRYATVTQRNPPQVRVGDYVTIRGNEVYGY